MSWYSWVIFQRKLYRGGGIVKNLRQSFNIEFRTNIGQNIGKTIKREDAYSGHRSTPVKNTLVSSAKQIIFKQIVVVITLRQK